MPAWVYCYVKSASNLNELFIKTSTGLLMDPSESHTARDLELRISRMRQGRLEKSKGASEILSWVSKSRRIGKKPMSEKSKKVSRSFDDAGQRGAEELGGLKVVHGGLDKVIEAGGAVVLTLKDQSILGDDGDINQEIDMLENVEIGEQKRRDEAYKAAKKRNNVYDDDKFNNELNTERKILPQYDDPVGDEGFTLDASGGFSARDAEKKLDELRKRISGVSANHPFEDLNSFRAITSDYYTHEEMLQFTKPKKKKSSLRKKEKLGIDALESDAISTGLGTGDLGSRTEGERQAMKKVEQEKSEADMRSNAYKAAFAKADEASKALRRLDQTLTMKVDDDDNNPVFYDDDDLCKSLAKARKLAFKRKAEPGDMSPHPPKLKR